MKFVFNIKLIKVGNLILKPLVHGYFENSEPEIRKN